MKAGCQIVKGMERITTEAAEAEEVAAREAIESGTEGTNTKTQTMTRVGTVSEMFYRAFGDRKRERDSVGVVGLDDADDLEATTLTKPSWNGRRDSRKGKERRLPPLKRRDGRKKPRLRFT